MKDLNLQEKLTAPQIEALKILIAEVRAYGEDAGVPYGEGASIKRTTAIALQDRGLVTLKALAPSARPAKAGFGKAHNWKTVLTANRVMYATPALLDALHSKGKLKNPAKAPDKDGLIYLGLQDGYRHEYQHPKTGCVFAIEKFERSPHERYLGLSDFWGFYRVDDDATDAGESRVEDAHPYYSDAVKALRWWVTHATFDPRSRSWSYLGEK